MRRVHSAWERLNAEQNDRTNNSIIFFSSLLVHPQLQQWHRQEYHMCVCVCTKATIFPPPREEEKMKNIIFLSFLLCAVWVGTRRNRISGFNDDPLVQFWNQQSQLRLLSTFPFSLFLSPARCWCWFSLEHKISFDGKKTFCRCHTLAHDIKGNGFECSENCSIGECGSINAGAMPNEFIYFLFVCRDDDIPFHFAWPMLWSHWTTHENDNFSDVAQCAGIFIWVHHPIEPSLSSPLLRPTATCEAMRWGKLNFSHFRHNKAVPSSDGSGPPMAVCGCVCCLRDSRKLRRKTCIVCSFDIENCDETTNCAHLRITKFLNLCDLRLRKKVMWAVSRWVSIGFRMFIRRRSSQFSNSIFPMKFVFLLSPSLLPMIPYDVDDE